MSIRTKLLAIALLPLVATLILTATIFGTQSVRASNASTMAGQFEQRTALTEAAIAIGGELMASSQETEPRSAQNAVDRALVADSDFPLEVKASMNRAAVLVSQARLGPPSESWASYQAAIDDLTDSASAIQMSFPSVEVAANNDAVDAVVDVIASSDKAWVLFAQLGDSAVPPAQLTEISALFALSEQARADARRLGSGETANTIQTTLRLTESMSDFKRTALNSLSSTNLRLVTAQEGLAAATDYRERWMLAHERTAGSLSFQISNEQAEARRAQLLAGLGGLLALTLIGSLGLVVHKSITRPLQALLDGTDHLNGDALPAMLEQMRVADSEDSLPAPPELVKESDDEIGDLVNSFNDIGKLAHRLATQQLAIRENATETIFAIGERQARQLDRLLLGLNSLEIDEQNIAMLAKLGELDHLASALRRSAQSLIVLGGDYTERTWTRPVSVEKVARASLANVEAYDRVNLSEIVPAFVVGVAASDLQHILAELIDNSLTNSGPRTRVVVEGFWSGKRYVLIVSDDGPGMSSAEISVNNSMLSTSPRLDEKPIIKFGLTVVGQLGARHGIEVSLTPKDHGLNAIITLPSSLVSHTDEVQVPTSLSGAPAPRTQRQQAQLPNITSDNIPPGAGTTPTPTTPTTHSSPASSPPSDPSEAMPEGALGDAPTDASGVFEWTGSSEFDYEPVAIADADAAPESDDSPKQLASSTGSGDFKGAVDEKLAAVIESLNQP